MKNIRNRVHHNQSGVVSIMMTVIMIIVISLIVLGLAQVSRREQRQSSDSQLSSQAFYAAESGVNDVLKIFETSGVTPKTTCNNTPPYDTLSPTISTGVSYSCVLVDHGSGSIPGKLSTSPASYSLVTQAANLNKVTFSWTVGEGQSATTAGCPLSVSKQDLFRSGSATEPWACHYAVVRVDLVDATSLDRATLVNRTQTAFLVPNAISPTPGASSAFSPGSSHLLSAACNSTTCSYTITGLTGNAYYARVSGIYTNGTLTIKGADSLGNPVQFTDLATIDVTGKAQDVLRRIKVTVNLTGGNQNGDGGAAIISGDTVCKRFMVKDDGTATVDGEATLMGCN